MSNLMLKSSKEARRYFGIGAKDSALYIDHVLMINEQKEKFGSIYEKATTWYSLLNGIPLRKFNEDDYTVCYAQYNLMNALGEMVGVVELEDGSKKEQLSLEDRYINQTFTVMKTIFNLEEADDDISKEDKLEFIKTCFDKFKRQTQRETLHKVSYRVLKMNFLSLQSNGNMWFFDSRTADSGTGGIKSILTSEDGISRILSDLGKEQIVINMNTADLESSAEDVERYRQAKEDIFLHGVTDIATGKHYFCSAPSASSTRHVDFPFVVANTVDEIYSLWCEICGFSSIDDLVSNIGHRNDDGSISMVFAKVKARIAQNGANSLSTKITASERIRNRLMSAKVVFVPDCKGTISVPYKYQDGVGKLSMKHPDGSITTETV